MVTLLQVIIISFSLFALSRAILRFKSKEISLRAMFFWILVWSAAISISLVPQAVGFFAKIFGTRTADLVIFLGLIGSYYFMFRVYVALENQNKVISTLVREIAIKEATRDKVYSTASLGNDPIMTDTRDQEKKDEV